MKNILVYSLPYLPINRVLFSLETFNWIAISLTLINTTGGMINNGSESHCPKA